MSRYRIAFSVEILVNTIWFTLLGTATVLFGIYKVPRYSWILSVPVLIFGLVLLAGAVLYLFPRRVTISDSQLIVDYGLHYLHKRYNLQSILEVRFAKRSDEDDVKVGSRRMVFSTTPWLSAFRIKIPSTCLYPILMGFIGKSRQKLDG